MAVPVCNLVLIVRVLEVVSFTGSESSVGKVSGAFPRWVRLRLKVPACVSTRYDLGCSTLVITFPGTADFPVLTQTVALSGSAGSSFTLCRRS